MLHYLSRKIRHYFHVVSNIRPIVWIGLYIVLVPIFAVIYYLLPDGQFRIPDGGGVDFGSWLYYSIVTITTLGFGDYTPMHGLAQCVTAIEVMCGLIFLGFFLNAVGSMKSEIDVESEVEKQNMLHARQEGDKLQKNIPSILHTINQYLAYCYAVTTPEAQRADDVKFNPDFTFNDMADMFKRSDLPTDRTNLPAVTRLMHSANQTSLALDGLQGRVDLTLWPEVLEDCFGFVADNQMFSAQDELITKEADDASLLSKEIASWSGDLDFSKHPELQSIGELYFFIKKTSTYALDLEKRLTEIANTNA
ncbi:MAG: potassium channel family protein [Muribaculaceae bacterium]|nr:potassium channel family protein [Muribaculaceae bacterium]